MRRLFLIVATCALSSLMVTGNAQQSTVGGPPPGSFAQQVGDWGPVFVDGKLWGLRVRWVGEFFEQLGLDVGDVITELNGEAIAEKQLEVVNKLRTALENRTPFELEFRRNSMSHVVRYPLSATNG